MGVLRYIVSLITNSILLTSFLIVLAILASALGYGYFIIIVSAIFFGWWLYAVTRTPEQMKKIHRDLALLEKQQAAKKRTQERAFAKKKLEDESM